MSELLVRVGANDAALMRRMYGLDGTAPAVTTPDRLVVDAHTSMKTTDLATTARAAGVPLIVDPQTYYLQDVQHQDDAWAGLPYGHPHAITPADLMRPEAQDRLVAGVIEHQIACGATMLIAPYVHVEKIAGGWGEVQAGLWRRTRLFLARQNINLPVIALLALGWRCLHPTQGATTLGPLWDGLRVLHPAEVALAASKVHLGARPDERLIDLLSLVRTLVASYRVIAWQQGLL